MFREDREARDQRHQPKKGMLVGHESQQDRQNGRGSQQMVKERPDGHKERNGVPG